EEEVFLPGRANPLALSRRSPSLKLLQRGRDEAHRFAVSYSRHRRARRTITSELLAIPGIGPGRRRALLERLGSLAGVKTATPAPEVKARLPGRGWTMWRYREWLPLADQETPISLGEGGTPLLTVPRLAAKHGLRGLFVKEEGANPTGSFKARGLAAAVTRAALAGAKRLVVPTAGNAGVALAAYAARAGLPARGDTPATTPPPSLHQIRSFGGDLVLGGGRLGDGRK